MVFDLFGHSLSQATVVAITGECSRNLTGVEEHTRNLLQDAQVLHVDETSMRVGDTRHWLHVASSLTSYGCHRKRGAQATDAMGILPAFQGTMIHDFWAPYFRYSSDHAICNAHLLRELRGISENYNHQWSELLSNLLIGIKAAVDGAKKRRLFSRRRESLPLKNSIRRFSKQRRRKRKSPRPQGDRENMGEKKQSKAKNLLDRCRKVQEEILAFMKDFTIPFTNNQAERDLRMMKLKQKISGVFRSEEGAMNFCRVRGFISTIKKHDRPVLPELRRVFEGTPFMPTAAHRVP
ncbi:MAG: IS66 family transposase [Candidatus Methanoculleus thermohydrogenotrophicum]|nr:IS66 family transposase [Candidatus Methanoculleus thermohydrogenotrophicum]